MHRTIVLATEAAIVVIAGTYFVLEGFTGNEALTVLLLFLGVTSFALLVSELANAL
jgi:hypothetical protein